MTNYILAGGCDRKFEVYGKQLSETVRELSGDRPAILSCFFSRPDEDVEGLREGWDAWFRQYFGDDVTIHHAEKSTFLDQIAVADVVYFHGGRTDRLMAALKGYGNLREAFAGKTIIGSSAGANYLSTTAFSPIADTVEQGSGLVNVATVVHYGSKGFEGLTFEPEFWRSAAARVSEQAEKEVLLLAEGTFAVFNS